MPRGQATYVVEVAIKIDGGALAPDVLAELADLRVDQAIDIPDQAVLRFFDTELALANASTFAIGSAITIDLTNGAGSSETVMDGEITGLSVEQGSNGIFELVVTALDKAHRLARSVKVRTFVDQSDSDIVSQIASEHGLQASVDSTSIRHPYMLQAETDYAFLTRRALAVGYRWGVDGSKLEFKEPAEPGAGLTYERDELVSLRIRTSSSDAAATVNVRGWDPDSQQAVVGTAQPQTSLANGFGSDSTWATGVGTKASSMVASSRFGTGSLPDTASAQALAKSVAARIVSTQVAVRGVVDGEPALRPGTTVELTDLGSSLSGKFAVTAVEHVFGAESGYVSRFKCAGLSPSELVDLVRTPPASSPFSGLIVGVVTNVDDQEVPSRVKVKFPTLADNDESAWARIATPGAGPARGLQVLPEINDEVLVGFEQGDPARPVVLGGLWSKRNNPPMANGVAIANGKVVQRAFYTRKGHKLEFVETDSENKIILALGNGKATVTMNDDGITVATTGDINVTADGAISIKATRDLSLEGQNVKVKATTKVDVQGVEIAAKGTAKASIQAATTEVKADATLSLSGGAMAELKGGLVKLN